MQRQSTLRVGTDFTTNPDLTHLRAAQMGLPERERDVEEAQVQLLRQQQVVKLRFDALICPIWTKIHSLLREEFPNAIVSSGSEERGQLSLLLIANDGEGPLSADDVKQRVEDTLRQILCGDDDEAFDDTFALDCQTPNGEVWSVSLALRPKMLLESEQPSAIGA